MSLSSLQNVPTDLRYLLNLIKDEVKREINCHAIGTIITFDASTQTVSIVFNYKKTIKKGNSTSPNTYTDVIIDYPVLIRCPVIVVGGGGGYTTYPIFSGDTCLVMFCDRDIDLWLEKGSTTSPPNSERMHDISDAVALVGLSPVTKPILSYATDAIQTVFGNVVLRLSNLLASLVDVTGQRLSQSGFGQPYFGTTLPSGWLWCDGSSYSKNTYPYLFTAIGYTYGGSGLNFNVPDMRGRTPVGLKSGDSYFGTLGQKYGEETHILTIPELPAHHHSIATMGDGDASKQQIKSTGTFSPMVFQTGDTGNDVPHNNIQPSFTTNWIIKI